MSIIDDFVSDTAGCASESARANLRTLGRNLARAAGGTERAEAWAVTQLYRGLREAGRLYLMEGSLAERLCVAAGIVLAFCTVWLANSAISRGGMNILPLLDLSALLFLIIVPRAAAALLEDGRTILFAPILLPRRRISVASLSRIEEDEKRGRLRLVDRDGRVRRIAASISGMPLVLTGLAFTSPQLFSEPLLDRVRRQTGRTPPARRRGAAMRGVLTSLWGGAGVAAFLWVDPRVLLSAPTDTLNLSVLLGLEALLLAIQSASHLVPARNLTARTLAMPAALLAAGALPFAYPGQAAILPIAALCTAAFPLCGLALLWLPSPRPAVAAAVFLTIAAAAAAWATAAPTLPETHIVSRDLRLHLFLPTDWTRTESGELFLLSEPLPGQKRLHRIDAGGNLASFDLSWAEHYAIFGVAADTVVLGAMDRFPDRPAPRRWTVHTGRIAGASITWRTVSVFPAERLGGFAVSADATHLAIGGYLGSVHEVPGTLVCSLTDGATRVLAPDGQVAWEGDTLLIASGERSRAVVWEVATATAAPAERWSVPLDQGEWLRALPGARYGVAQHMDTGQAALVDLRTGERTPIGALSNRGVSTEFLATWNIDLSAWTRSWDRRRLACIVDDGRALRIVEPGRGIIAERKAVGTTRLAQPRLCPSGGRVAFTVELDYRFDFLSMALPSERLDVWDFDSGGEVAIANREYSGGFADWVDGKTLASTARHTGSANAPTPLSLSRWP